jgi:hypothetical protein
VVAVRMRLGDDRERQGDENRSQHGSHDRPPFR